MKDRALCKGFELLLRNGPQAINLALPGFAEALRAQGVPVVHVDWTPPTLDEELARLLVEVR